MIQSNDISIVVQGAIDENHTQCCLKSLRTILPYAEIILSTWKNSNVSGFEFDSVVFSSDPGNTILDETGMVYNNVNRQIVSTQAGLHYASKLYCLKIRSDILLVSDMFLRSYNSLTSEKKPATCLKMRLLVCDFYTRNPRVLPLPYHLSDWLLFGLTDDVKKVFNVPLQSLDEALWFRTHKKGKAIFQLYLSRYTPEQHMWYIFLNNFKKIHFEHYFNATKENIALTEKFIAENMIIVNYKKQMNVVFLKYNPDRYREKYSLIDNKDWDVLYEHYVLHKGLVRWFLYCLTSHLKKLVMVTIKYGLIKLLAYLGLKEKMKKIINKNCR